MEKGLINLLPEVYREAYKKGIIKKGAPLKYVELENADTNATGDIFKFLFNNGFSPLVQYNLMLGSILLYDLNVVNSIVKVTQYSDGIEIKSKLDNSFNRCIQSYPENISSEDLVYFCPSIISTDMNWSKSKVIQLNKGYLDNFVLNYCTARDNIYYFHIYMNGNMLSIDALYSRKWKCINVPEESISKLLLPIFKVMGISPDNVSDLYISYGINCTSAEYKCIARKLPNGELVITIY